jgi:hypothetical protein
MFEKPDETGTIPADVASETPTPTSEPQPDPAAAPLPEIAPEVVEPRLDPVLEAQLDVPVDTLGIPFYGNLTSCGLIPAERNRLRTNLEDLHRRTTAAHDRING